jgi:cation/acetate symporter
MLNVVCITLALMAGTAGLPHILVRFYTVPSVRAARWSAGWALLFIALLYTTAPAIAVFARYNLIDSIHGKTVAEAREQGWVTSWEATGLLTLDDKDGDGRLKLAPDPAVNEIRVDPDIMVLATPEVAGLAPWVIALVAAGGLAAALSTAAGLLLVISSSIAHDIYARLINPRADDAKCLLVGRAMILVAIVVAGWFGINPPGFVAEVVAFAFGLAAASFFPVILLGIFDRRTNRAGAIAGMLIGIGFTGAYIVGNRFFGMPAWCFGIGAQGIGAVGLVLNLVTTVVVSRLTAPPSAEVQELVEAIRMPGAHAR